MADAGPAVAGGAARDTTQQQRLAARLDPAGCALVVVDAQNDFCHPEGLQARQGKDVSRVAEPLRRLQVLVDAARQHGVPVILVRTTHSAATDTTEWLARHPDPSRLQSCQDGSWGADFCGVQPEPGDHVVVKHRYSAFTSAELTSLLHRLDRRSLLFTGFTTGTCVESSLRDAVCNDFMATLVEDCCAAYTERAHARAVEAVRDGFGVVTVSPDVIGLWQAAGRAAEVAVAHV